MILIRKLLLLLLSSQVLISCVAVSTDSDDDFGFVVGSIGFRANDIETSKQLREIRVHIRKENNIIFDAADISLKRQGDSLSQTTSFSATLQPGNYEIDKIRVKTAGFDFVADVKPLMTFAVDKNRITYIGLLELQVESQDGVFARVLKKQVLLVNRFERQQEDMESFASIYNKFRLFPVHVAQEQDRQKITLITKEKYESDYYYPE